MDPTHGGGSADRRAATRCDRIPFIVVAFLVAAAPAYAQSSVSLSPDMTLAHGAAGEVIADHGVVVDNLLGLVVAEDLGPLEASDALAGYAQDLGGDHLLAFETTVALLGGVVARPGDIVRWDGATYTLEWDAAAAGVPHGARVDALAVSYPGLLLSFDTTVDLGTVVADDEDLVRWDDGVFSLVFDGSAVGLDRELDIDGVDHIAPGTYVLSFDTGGTAGGTPFDDDDLVEWDGAGFSVLVDAASLDPDWAAADVEAVMVPEPAGAVQLAAGSIGLAWLLHMRRRSERVARLGPARTR